jgi:cell division protein FtsW (lipid II flippase)
VEFGKLAFVFVLASICVSFARIDFFYTQRQYVIWLVLSILTLAVFFLIMTAVPFLKSDYSPILIILATTVVLFFAFLLPAAVKRIGGMVGVLLRRNDAPQAKQRRLGWPRGGALASIIILLLALNAALVFAFPRLANRAIAGQWHMPTERAKSMDLLEQAREGAFRKPAERLLTWYDLDHHSKREEGQDRTPDVAHRDLGFQLLQSKIALAEMPCGLARLKTGTDRLPEPFKGYWTKLAAFAPDTCELMPSAAKTPILEKGETPSEEGGRGYGVRDLMRLPVIQNDFIATYMTVRFGLPMVLLLVTAEFAAVVSAAVIAFGLLGRRARGSANEAARYGLAIASIGIAALFGLHWGISWGNAVGILPVMGQPMTFLAAATSHHLLMALPGVALLLLAGRMAAIRARRIHREPPAWGLLK